MIIATTSCVCTPVDKSIIVHYNGEIKPANNALLHTSHDSVFSIQKVLVTDLPANKKCHKIQPQSKCII